MKFDRRTLFKAFGAMLGAKMLVDIARVELPSEPEPVGATISDDVARLNGFFKQHYSSHVWDLVPDSTKALFAMPLDDSPDQGFTFRNSTDD